MRSISLLTTAAVLMVADSKVCAGTAPDVIGVPTMYITRDDDTLLDIALANDVGYIEMRLANPGVDPWLPGANLLVTVPTQHIVPAGPRRGIVINLPELRLYYFPADGSLPQSFPVGIGDEGKETPLGYTEVVRKAVDPRWVPTHSEHEDDPELPAVVEPGPDNPMGDHALYLGFKGYAIHGTNKPYGVGRRVSHGCIRMYPQDIDVLFKQVGIGTPVAIVDQPVKAGWLNGVLYLEVHPPQSDADAIEATGRPRSAAVIAVDDMVEKAAGRDVDLIDWNAVRTTALERTGLPTPIAAKRFALPRLKPSYRLRSHP